MVPVASKFTDHQEIVIVFDDEPLRFWLPKDRPLSHLLDAIVEASPFKQSTGGQTFDLQIEGVNEVLDLTLDLRRYAWIGQQRLRLVRRNLPDVYLQFRDMKGNERSKSIFGNMVIGYSRDEYIPDLDIREIAQGDWVDGISRKHARILDVYGQYRLQVLHENGVDAGGTHYEQGEVISLRNGMELVFVKVVLRVIVAKRV
ncbi:MAG: hypothetical protein RLP44_10290 [Aggregatilineales bacterium]